MAQGILTMQELPQDHTIYLASHNKHKLFEFQDLIGQELQSLAHLKDERLLTPPEENGRDFLANAWIKARHAYHILGRPVLADDSGLCVRGLGGKPGLWSARFAGANASDRDNRRKLIELCRNLAPEDLLAQFICVLCYIDEKGGIFFAKGTCEGQILREEKGQGGFGYDPVFYLPEQGCTMAELSSENKNRVSHRAKAVQVLLQSLPT